MNTQAEELKKRTKKFAIDVLEFLDAFPTAGPPSRIALQLTDSATSVAANYRAACRSRSKAEFAAKIGVVLEESDESSLWLEISDERGLGAAAARRRLLVEAGELTAIFAQSSITARSNLK